MDDSRFNAVGRTLKRFRVAQLAPLALASLISGQAASAMTINLTFTAAFNTDFGANSAAAQASATAAAAIFTNAFVDPIAINISMTAVTGTGTLGMSSTPIANVSYTSLRTAVVNDAKSADDTTATGAGGSVAASDPGGGDLWWVTRAQEKALGLIATDGANDGTITVGTGFSYSFSGAVGPGQIDLTDVFAHEISEIMGRIGISGGNVGGSPSLTLLDEFSYTGAATRGLGGGAGNFFSINNGNTLLKGFNNAVANGGDTRDWASGSNDSFNAFSSSGVTNPVTAVDFREMDVLGYDPTTVSAGTPEPATSLLLIPALALGAFIRRRRSA